MGLAVFYPLQWMAGNVDVGDLFFQQFPAIKARREFETLFELQKFFFFFASAPYCGESSVSLINSLVTSTLGPLLDEQVSGHSSSLLLLEQAVGRAGVHGDRVPAWPGGAAQWLAAWPPARGSRG